MFKIFRKIKDLINSLYFRRKLRKTDLMSLVKFQKFCEENPIKADMSYLERLYEVFE